MRATLLIVAGGLFALALILLLRWAAPSGLPAAPRAPEVAKIPPFDAHTPPPRNASPGRVPVDVSRKLSVDEEPSLDSRCVEGQVVCAGTQLPLAAWVQASHHGVLADLKSGRFRIEVKASDANSLRFTADGYRERILDLGDYPEREDNVGVIELESRRSLRVRVVDTWGAPVAGARVMATALDPPGGLSAMLREVGRTDDRGVLPVNVGQPLAVFAHLGFRTSNLGQCDISSECQLVVGRGEVRLGLADSQTGLPISGIQIQVRRFSGYPQVEFRGETGPDGLFEVPLPQGQYTATLVSPSVFFDEKKPGARDSFSGIGARKAVVKLGGGQTEPHWLQVSKRPSLVVEVLDIDTRKRLDDLRAWISSWEEPPFVPEAAWTRMAGDSLHATDGIISLYAFGLLFRGHGERVRLSVSSPGYLPGHVVDPLAAITPGFPQIVLLHRGETRRVQLKTFRGAPYLREVYVRENGDVVNHGWPDGNGRLSEFPWTGGELTIHNGPNSWSRRLATVPASLLHSNACPVLTIDADAEIRVQLPRIPPPPLACVGEPRERYAGRLVGHELVFRQLPPGRYEIGVPEALATLELRRAQGFETFPISLRSGDIRLLEWDDAWTPLEETLTGYVTALGIDPGDIQVIPRWGPQELPLAGGDRMRRFPVAKDGSFRLPGVHVRPSFLMFVRAWKGARSMPIGIGHLGEASALACSPVTVLVEGETSKLVRVSFTPGVEGHKVVGSFGMSGPSSTPIELGPIPSGTDRLRVVVGGKRRDVNLSLRPGEPTLVQVK